jgi:hypothetical protein
MRDAVQKTTYQEKATSANIPPTCASFDLFENYEDRGKPIQTAVRNFIENKKHEDIFKRLKGDKGIWALLLFGLLSFMPVFSASSNGPQKITVRKRLCLFTKTFMHILIWFELWHQVHRIRTIIIEAFFRENIFATYLVNVTLRWLVVRR